MFHSQVKETLKQAIQMKNTFHRFFYSKRHNAQSRRQDESEINNAILSDFNKFFIFFVKMTFSSSSSIINDNLCVPDCLQYVHMYHRVDENRTHFSNTRHSSPQREKLKCLTGRFLRKTNLKVCYPSRLRHTKPLLLLAAISY